MKRNKKQKILVPGKAGLLLPSLYGVIVCIAITVSVAFAWYSDSVDVKENKLVTADYGVTVTVAKMTDQNTTESVTSVEGNPLQYELGADSTYQVAVTATGSAQTGYYTMEIMGTSTADTSETSEASSSACEDTYYQQLVTDTTDNKNVSTFKLVLGNTITKSDGAGSEEVITITSWKITFTPSWGECSTENNLIVNDVEINTANSDTDKSSYVE